MRLRKLYVRMFGDGLAALQPHDNHARIYEEIDFSDVLIRVGREFKLKIPRAAVTLAPSSNAGEIDGTFDSVVRYVSRVTCEPCD